MILVVDDDADIRKPLIEILQANGYDAIGAADGVSALEAVKASTPDLAILDIMMPKMNGYDLCNRLNKQYGELPVIFLSAKGDIVDKAMGFRSGADDYVTKPFDSEELLMRIEAVLRRFRAPLSQTDVNVVAMDDLVIHLKQYHVTIAGKPVDLTAREFELLAYMAAYPRQVFTRMQIYEGVWGEPNAGDCDIVTVYIRKIRERIEIDPKHPKHLVTVWGVGYKLL